jgi:hypothetical protein
MFICVHAVRLTAYSSNKSRQSRASTFQPLEDKLPIMKFVKIAQLSHGMATISTLRLKNDGMRQNVDVEGATSANVDCGVSVNPADHSILTSAPALSELARLRAQPPKVSFKYIFLGVPRYQGDTIRESVEVVRNVFT